MPLSIQSAPALPLEFVGLAGCGSAHSGVDFRGIVESQLEAVFPEDVSPEGGFASNLIRPQNGPDLKGRSWSQVPNPHPHLDEEAPEGAMTFVSVPWLIDSLAAEAAAKGTAFDSQDTDSLEYAGTANEVSVDLEDHQGNESQAADSLSFLPTVISIFVPEEQARQETSSPEDQPTGETEPSGKVGQPAVPADASLASEQWLLVSRPASPIPGSTDPAGPPKKSQADEDITVASNFPTRQASHSVTGHGQSEKQMPVTASFLPVSRGVPEPTGVNKEAFSLAISTQSNSLRSPNAGSSVQNPEPAQIGATAPVKSLGIVTDAIELSEALSDDAASDGQNSGAGEQQFSSNQPRDKSDFKQPLGNEDLREFRPQPSIPAQGLPEGPAERQGPLSAETHFVPQVQTIVPGSIQTDAAPPTAHSEAPSPEPRSFATRVWESALVESAPARSLHPMREIDLRLPVESHMVDVQLRERAGLLDVSVRTSDAALARDMQAGLGELVRNLESQGYDAAPRNLEEPVTQRIQEPLTELGADANSHDSPQGGSANGETPGGQGQRGRRHRQQNAPDESSFFDALSAGALPISETGLERSNSR